MFNKIEDSLNSVIVEVLKNYGTIFAIFILGLVAGIVIKQYIIDRDYKKSVKERLNDKDVTINDLRQIIHERMNKMTVQEDIKFFKKIKSYFKRRRTA